MDKNDLNPDDSKNQNNEQTRPPESASNIARTILRRVSRVVVLMLIAILAIFAFWPQCGISGAQIVGAETQISVFQTALGAFQSDNGSYPKGTNGLVYLTQKPSGATNWRGPYLEQDIPLDPWGHPYIYESPGAHNPQSYDLSCNGPDGQIYGNWK